MLLGGSDRTTSEVNRLVSQLPPAIQALTGVDLTGVGVNIAVDDVFFRFFVSAANVVDVVAVSKPFPVTPIN